jgi:hypothetical protein
MLLHGLLRFARNDGQTNKSSYSAKAEYPVRRSFSIPPLRPRTTGSPGGDRATEFPGADENVYPAAGAGAAELGEQFVSEVIVETMISSKPTTRLTDTDSESNPQE